MSYHSKSGDTHGSSGRAPRLPDEMRRVLRVKHYSLRTEQVYVGWIRRFIPANGKRYPQLEAFISHLASQGQAAALSSHRDALGAFLGAFFHLQL